MDGCMVLGEKKKEEGWNTALLRFPNHLPVRLPSTFKECSFFTGHGDMRRHHPSVQSLYRSSPDRGESESDSTSFRVRRSSPEGWGVGVRYGPVCVSFHHFFFFLETLVSRWDPRWKKDYTKGSNFRTGLVSVTVLVRWIKSLTGSRRYYNTFFWGPNLAFLFRTVNIFDVTPSLLFRPVRPRPRGLYSFSSRTKL